MLHLKCTTEVQKLLRLRKEQLSEPGPSSAPLGDWYVHRFFIERAWVYLFMSEVSLLSFVLLKGNRPVNAASLPDIFLGGLHQLLTMRGMSADTIERAMAPYHTGGFARTDSHKLRGCMNDLVRCYTVSVIHSGGLKACDLTDIIFGMNEMPQRTLNWSNSWRVTEALLESRGGPLH